MMACERGEGLETVVFTVDSGAVDHVAPKEVAGHIGTESTSASRKQLGYITASGHQITNRGQKTVHGYTREGSQLGIAWQVPDVQRPLASVGRMCEVGNVVLFTDKGGFIADKGMAERLIAELSRKTVGH